MLKSIIEFLFPSVTDALYHEGYLAGARRTAEEVCQYPAGVAIVEAIIENLDD
jgi:hypothetical protein